MPPIIRVQELSKHYYLGGSAAAYSTFREVVMEMARLPLRYLRRAKEPESIWALKDVSFEIEPGDVVGIIGRNGAGKSTLLKVLSRITEPTTGRVELYGRVASLLEVGTGFHPELTGRENVFLNGALLGMSRAEIKRKFGEIVAFGLDDRYFDTYADKVRAQTPASVTAAAAKTVQPDRLVWVIVGDRARIESSLRELDLGEIHLVDADGNPVTAS